RRTNPCATFTRWTTISTASVAPSCAGVAAWIPANTSSVAGESGGGDMTDWGHADWVPVAQFHRALDLRLLTRRLAERGIDHGVNRVGDVQGLWVSAEGPVEEVAELVRALAMELPAGEPVAADPLSPLRRAPVTALFLLVSVLGAAL